jgi:hypothetical protein
MRQYNLPIVASQKRHFPNVIHALIRVLNRGSVGHWRRQGGPMKLFSRFFPKVPPSPPSLEERITMLHTGSADLILGTALGTDEEGLRVAAIHRLPDGDDLRRLAGLSASADSASVAFPAALKQAAQARLAGLIDEGSVDFAKFCDQAENRSVMFSVAALCKDSGRLPEALARIDDPIQVTRLVVENSSSRLRQLAAQAVEDPVQLRQLLKQVRGKDKNVYKILKQKCDVLNAEDRKMAELASEVNALCESLERHSHRTFDAFYTSAFERLNARWRALTTPRDENTEQRAAQAIDRCREVIEGHLRHIAEQAALQVAEQAARDVRERAYQAAQEAAAAQADAEAQLLREAAALREAAETARAEKRAAEEQVFRQIGGLIRKADGALSDGNTQKAAGLRRAIEEKWPTASAVPTHLTRHLQQLDDKLNELKQWKDYAVAPKRIELIEEMETLIGSTEEPKVLSERIKSLQQEWRTISKGIVSDASADWERFHRASQAAYQPCREYFEAQATLRQQNLENRKALLERLTAFEATQNGEHPDWRLLASVLREAPQEWRQYFPVDREANRAVQEDFQRSMGRLQARLDTWYESNVADKQSLIKRARHLLTQEDSREAIEAMKRLQILWKETGPAPRDQDQSLWSEFRELCDAVYQKRQQAYAEYSAGLEATKVKAVALCEEGERIAALSGAALLEGRAKLAELRTAFDALDEMPRGDARGLQDRFERAVDLCEARIAQQQLRDAEQSFHNLFEAGRHIRAYDWAASRNADVSEQETLKQAAETFIASVQHWPKGGLQAVKEALANAGSVSDADSADRERSLRMLCIRCEIYGEMPTPPEDEALRREYQVQRLVQGMGQGRHADDGDWDAMTLEWIRIGAISPAIHESLQSRFVRCRATRAVRNPHRSAALVGDGADNRKDHGSRAGQTRRHGREGSQIAPR